MSDSMYYDSHDIMTRNAMFNFVIGGRGTGKTYDFKYKQWINGYNANGTDISGGNEGGGSESGSEDHNRC